MGSLIVIIVLPVIVLFGGLPILARVSGRTSVKSFLGEKTLDRRPQGYDESVVHRQWDALAKAGLLATERRFLQLDLAFPLFYGGSFAASFILAWGKLDRVFNPVWVLLPVCLMCLADWAENLLLLGQIQEHPRLRPGRIRIASYATRLKWLCLCGLFLLLALLVILCFLKPKD